MFHVVGPARTIEGELGLRIEADCDVAGLPHRVPVIDTDGTVRSARVIGSDPDGWPVVADPHTDPPPANQIHEPGPIGITVGGLKGHLIDTILPIGAVVRVGYPGETMWAQVIGFSHPHITPAASVVAPL